MSNESRLTPCIDQFFSGPDAALLVSFSPSAAALSLCFPGWTNA
jgi:hypothetical protein